MMTNPCLHPDTKNMRTTLALDDELLAKARAATDREVLQFIGRHKLFGLGIGYVDAHLLAAARLTDGAELWTRDKHLHAAARKLGLAPVP